MLERGYSSPAKTSLADLDSTNGVTPKPKWMDGWMDQVSKWMDFYLETILRA